MDMAVVQQLYGHVTAAHHATALARQHQHELCAVRSTHLGSIVCALGGGLAPPQLCEQQQTSPGMQRQPPAELMCRQPLAAALGAVMPQAQVCFWWLGEVAGRVPAPAACGSVLSSRRHGSAGCGG